MKNTLVGIFSDYGMLVVLVLLVAILSIATIQDQFAEGKEGGAEVAGRILENNPTPSVLIIGQNTGSDREFAASMQDKIAGAGGRIAGMVLGTPKDGKAELERLAATGAKVDSIACVLRTARWAIFTDANLVPIGSPGVVAPEGRKGSNFLTRSNLSNVTDQTAVIGIIAIGMTLIIITAGIDLSVGSLIALSSVIATMVIQKQFGGEAAGTLGVISGSASGIFACGLIGLFSGSMVTYCRVPPFIATLAVMLMASGLAHILSNSSPISAVPHGFNTLGVGNTLGVPNAVILMIALYLSAHFMMSQTVLGRYIYAVGGNPEAARLSGVPVKWVLLFVYTLTGLLAGVSGIVTASKLESGDPTYGGLKELQVIAAVVVGGTSLAGGEGKVLGTLIGALIIGVIANGMNLMGIESNDQKFVLGAVILGAALIDQLKRRVWGSGN